MTGWRRLALNLAAMVVGNGQTDSRNIVPIAARRTAMIASIGLTLSVKNVGMSPHMRVFWN
jgi:hypothetical protein